MHPSDAELALAVLAVLIVVLGVAVAIALLAPAPAAAEPVVVSLTEIYGVIADATRITREAAQ